MKKIALLLFLLLLPFCLSACTEEAVTISTSPSTEQAISSAVTENSDNTSQDASERTLILEVDGSEIPITLYDTPTANALYDMLPLELTFQDYNGVEKISYLKDKLPTQGEPDGCDPAVGDLCLYAPWGNLSIFYKDFRYSNSLIKLGHIDVGIEIIEQMPDDVTVTLKKQ